MGFLSAGKVFLETRSRWRERREMIIEILSESAKKFAKIIRGFENA